ncbi:MAG: PBP1A family penicillin-binding protein [Spirochaetes bacterium]|nr:PBP1A family penicillin-binding protein [Spirochaetota bacterium]
MFKKYDGHSSRFKKTKKNRKNSSVTGFSEREEKIENNDNEDSFIIINEREDSTDFAIPGSKKKLKKEQTSKKKYIFSYKSAYASNTFSSFFKKIKNSFRINKALILGLAAGFIIAFIAISVTVIITDYKRVKALGDYEPNITTNIYDKNGLLISELFRQKREIVELKKIPEDLINAVIAKEDNEFYSHSGINIKGIIRAFFIDIMSGSIKQGGSTITQQLAKLLLTSRERTIVRKVKEFFIAIMIEMRYSKNQILEMYFNQIFLGHGVYGVESAAKFYFNKHVWELNLAESSLIATLPSAPNKLSPIRHPNRSFERHKIVLAKMVDCGYIDIPAAEKAYLDFWPAYLEYINEFSPTMTSWSNKVDRAPWFTEYIRRRLIKKYGEQKVYGEGMSVYTTLDLKKQLAAQRIVHDSLEKQNTISNSLSFKNEDYIIENFSDDIQFFSLFFDFTPDYKSGSLETKKLNDYIQKEILDELDELNLLTGLSNVGTVIADYRDKNSDHKNYQDVEGALISIDQSTGYIEALVGGSEFSSINQLNRVTQSSRQPGSAIKPLIYASAIESKKFTPATTVLDSPIVYPDAEGLDWIPENYESIYFGNVRLRFALKKSINIISVNIIQQLGIDYVRDYIAKLLKIEKKNISKRIPRNMTIALGSFEVEPFEIARAYAIIANGGRDVIPFSIRYIKDRNGEIIENTEEKVKGMLIKEKGNGSLQIIDPQTSQIMISMLESVMNSGTGVSANFGWPAGGKTGTTNNWRDAWFVGFSPAITTCLWVGYDTPGLSLGIGQSGGGVAAPMWGEYMAEAHANEANRDFPVFADLVTAKVCAVSGLLPSYCCNKQIDEIFIEGTVPEEECNVCSERKYNIDPSKTGPKENIIKNQKDSILKRIKDKKDASSILKDVGGDFLEE